MREKKLHLGFFSLSPLSSWAPTLQGGRKKSSSCLFLSFFFPFLFLLAKFFLLFADKALVYSSQSIDMWPRDILWDITVSHQ